MTATTARTRECRNRAMRNRFFAVKVGPEDYGRRFTIKVDVERLAQQDACWRHNRRRENPGKSCECQFCNLEDE